MRTIDPGERLTYRFTATRAGIWMYHCSTMPMLRHIGNGMYGAVIIDPPGPAGGRPRVRAGAVRAVPRARDGEPGDLAKMQAERPDAVVFNGYAEPVRPPAADRRRPGSGCGSGCSTPGPNRPASFHVVGAQFDTVYREGPTSCAPAPTRAARRCSTLAPAAGGFVETVFPEAGHYPFVCHAMVDAERGARGVVRGGGHHDRPIQPCSRLQRCQPVHGGQISDAQGGGSPVRAAAARRLGDAARCPTSPACSSSGSPGSTCRCSVAWLGGYLLRYYVFQSLKTRRPRRLPRPVDGVRGTDPAARPLVVAAARPAVLWYAPAYAAADRGQRLVRVAAPGTGTAERLRRGGAELPDGVRGRHRRRRPLAPMFGVFLACAAYFTGTVFYVKTMIRERGNPAYLRWSSPTIWRRSRWACLGRRLVAVLFGWLLLRSWFPPAPVHAEATGLHRDRQLAVAAGRDRAHLGLMGQLRGR